MQTVDDRRTPTEERSKKSLEPNYFVTIQITDKQTIKNLRDEQRDILSRYPRYEDFEMPPNSFHLTLTVLQLDNEQHIKACIDAMDKAKPKIEELAKRANQLTFQGLGCFSPRVIFAKVEYSSEFMELVDVIRTVIKSAGIKLDLKPLKPHVTLFKVDPEIYNDRRWYKGKVILASHFDPDPYFGYQTVNNIQICEMNTLPCEEGETGFYRSIYDLRYPLIANTALKISI